VYTWQRATCVTPLLYCDYKAVNVWMLTEFENIFRERTVARKLIIQKSFTCRSAPRNVYKLTLSSLDHRYNYVVIYEFTRGMSFMSVHKHQCLIPNTRLRI